MGSRARPGRPWEGAAGNGCACTLSAWSIPNPCQIQGRGGARQPLADPRPPAGSWILLALELLQDRASFRLWSSHAHSQGFDSRPLGAGCASRAGDSRSAPRGRGHHPSLPRGARTMCCPRVTARGQRAAPGGSGFALGSGSGITSLLGPSHLRGAGGVSGCPWGSGQPRVTPAVRDSQRIPGTPCHWSHGPARGSFPAWGACVGMP